MPQKFKDDGRAHLQANISPSATSITVEAGLADRFPIANTPDWSAPVDWFKCALIDSSGNREVVKVGLRSAGSGVLSNVLRAQDGTTALAFTVGSLCIHAIMAADIENALAGSFASLVALATLTVGTKIIQQGVEGRVVPVGGIIPWSGASNAIPTGWVLCNGLNGTPNLQDRFIVGAGLNYAVGATGGTKDTTLVSHFHGVNIGANTGVESASHVHSVNDPGHIHTANFQVATGGGGYPGFDGSGDAYTVGGTGGAATGISLFTESATHYHFVSIVGNTGFAGASGVNMNLPPYYALCYIMCKAAP